jgi:DNA-binding CsgD family transcriptional regulator
VVGGACFSPGAGLYCPERQNLACSLGIGVDLSLLLELDLIGLIYDAVLEPDRWSGTLDQVRRFVELQTVVLSVNALPGGELAAFGSSNIPPEFMRLLPELGGDVVAIWGGPQIAARLPLEQPLILSEYSDPQSWAGNGFYERFARPQGLVDTLLLVLEYNPSLVGTVGFGRHESMPPISKAQTKALRILAPHFRRAAVLSGLMVARSQTASTFGDVIEGLRLPVFLVRSDLSVVHQNASATHMTREFPKLRTASGKLAFPGEIVSGQIEAAVRAAIEDSGGLAHGAGVPFRPNENRTLVVHVLPLKRRHVSPEPSAVAALFVVDPARRLDYPLDTVKLIYGLRPAEVRVLDLTLRGLTGPQIAGELSVAPSTVKTHMQALFEKFGVSNKVELVSAVFAATQTVFS